MSLRCTKARTLYNAFVRRYFVKNVKKNCVCNPNASQSAQYRDVDYADEGMIVGGRGLARYGPRFTNLVHIDSSCD